MTTWVLLRGLMREQRHWGDFPSVFKQAMPQADIVTPDLPGNGSLYHLTSANNVADIVAFCRSDLRARGFVPPYHLLALSLGAMVALEWSASHPDEVAGAVLINTSMRPFSRFYQRLRWRNYRAILALMLQGGIERQERLILRLTSNGLQSHAGVLENWCAYQRQHPVSRANALRQLLAAARYRAPRTRPDVPMLVLASMRDRLVDYCCSQQLARHWQFECHLHGAAGHDLTLDDGAWVGQKVVLWMARNGL